MNPILLYNNLLLTATISSSAIAAGYSNQNVLDMRPYTLAKFNAAGTNYISGNLGSAKAVNCVGIANHNFYTVSATVNIYYSANGSDWTLASTVTPASSKTIILSFTQQTKQYWKVEVVNSSGQPYCGVIYLGTAILFDWPPMGPISPSRESIIAEDVDSESGNLLGIEVKFIPKEITRTWNYQTKTFYDTYLKPFWDNHGSLLKPFFYADDLTNRADQVYYLRLKKEMVFDPQYSDANNYDSFTLDMKLV